MMLPPKHLFYAHLAPDTAVSGSPHPRFQNSSSGPEEKVDHIRVLFEAMTSEKGNPKRLALWDAIHSVLVTAGRLSPDSRGRPRPKPPAHHGPEGEEQAALKALGSGCLGSSSPTLAAQDFARETRRICFLMFEKTGTDPASLRNQA